jgi:DNA-3-methyladenine glycosylase II
VPSKHPHIETAVAHLRRADPGLRPLIEQFGAPPGKSRLSAYETLTRAIVFQQLNGKAAKTIYDRFRALYPPGAYPKPEMIQRTPLKKLKSVGLSARKASYIVDLAGKFADGTIRPRQFAKMSDEEISDRLTQVKGVGQWTADMFLMFQLQRPDVLPVGDYGVRKGMQLHFELAEMPEAETMIELAKPWAPYRSVASWYMWRWLDMEAVG